MALIGSASSTRQETFLQEINNTLAAQDEARTFLNSLGGIKVSGGGKKSTTNVSNEINLIDGGAIDLAQRAIGEGFDVTSKAIEEASQSREQSIATANRALDLAEANGGSEGLELLKTTMDQAVTALAIGLAGIAVIMWLRG